MPNLRDLNRRRKSVKNTAQITKAMQMVAATKMRRAQNQALAGRDYTQNLNISLANLLPKIDITTHPLLQANEAKATGVILLSTNKALAGALNTNLFRAVQNRFGAEKEVKYFSYGLKGRNFIVKSGKLLEADFESPETIAFRQARQIANLVKNAYLEGLVKEVYLAFPDFVSTLRQEPVIIKLLPIDPDSLKLKDSLDGAANSKSKVTENSSAEFLFEPNPMELLDFILNHNLEVKIFQALLETKASEHSARMMAMQNATDNALELVDDLTLTYNQTRQDAITRELLEITTAGLALE